MDLFLTEDGSIINLSAISYIKKGEELSTVSFSGASPIMISKDDYSRVEILVQRRAAQQQRREPAPIAIIKEKKFQNKTAINKKKIRKK